MSDEQTIVQADSKPVGPISYPPVSYPSESVNPEQSVTEQTTVEELDSQIAELQRQRDSIRANNAPSEAYGVTREPLPTDQSLAAVQPQNPDPLTLVSYPTYPPGTVAKPRGIEICERMGISDPNSIEGLAARVAELEFAATGR